jgi:arginase
LKGAFGISEEARIALLGAPTAIGISPYREGGARRVDAAPAALRAAGIVERLGANDLGDLDQLAPYRDADRPVDRIRNEADVVAYSALLADRIGAAAGPEQFVVVLGGDCTVLLGALSGLRAHGGAVGLVYVDGHADFASLEESPSGSACSMNLALAVGRHGDDALVQPRRVVHIGRRDEDDTEYGSAALQESPIADFPARLVRSRGPHAVAEAALARVSRETDGFWIHLDVDVLDPSVMPAVDSPLAGGFSSDEAVELLGPIVAHPKALGMDVTIYDPSLDQGDDGARLIVDLLSALLRP